MPGDGKIPAEVIEYMVETVASLHDDPTEILAAIEDTATSCVKWGGALQSLFIDGTLDELYVHHHNDLGEVVPMRDFDTINLNLRNGNAILVHVKLPEEGIDHVFTVVGDGEKALVLHAWQNQHGIRAEESMPIDEMVSLLDKLDNFSNDFNKIGDVRAKLWGSDHRGPGAADIGTSSRKKITYNMILSGKPRKPLLECKETLGSLSQELSEWLSVSSEQSSDSEAHAATRVKNAAGFNAGFGFVLGAGGALSSHADFAEILEEGGVAKSKAGSVVQANAAAGAAMFSVFDLWNVAKWANNTTAVELRKNIAKGAAGAITGGMIGAARGAIFGPAGVFVGGVIGSWAGAGKAFDKEKDKPIWDEGEDSVMNSYEFFGWQDVKSGERPLKSAEAITAAYTSVLNEKPSNKLTDEDWATYCTANLMVLLRAMYPELKAILKMSEDLRNNSSKAVSIIGSTMYSSTLVSSSTATTPGTKEEHNGTYFIENVFSKRYVFQAGGPIKGKRGAEGGWKRKSPANVVGSDANYYNLAYWKISHKGDGKHFIENVETKRYLFPDGQPIQGERGEEQGWLADSGYQSPIVVGADANYYNRAYWHILRQKNGDYFIENVKTRRYLFQDGDPIKGKRGAEGGWTQSPNFVGADANYQNRAYFKLTKLY